LKKPNEAIGHAVSELLIGGIVAYPTEAVWGLGCDPYNQSAVNKILNAKGRPEDKGLILVAASIQQISSLLNGLPADQLAMLQASWPGPTTWVIEDYNHVYPAWVKGKHSSVAVRVTDHPLVVELCEAFGDVIVSTSANPSGRPPALSQEQAASYFGPSVGYYLDGPTSGSDNPSAIYSLDSGLTLR